MIHKPIIIHNLSFTLPHKLCFEGFSAIVQPGRKIGIIGKNGSGKTMLLKMIAGEAELASGDIDCFGAKVGYVPQTIECFDSLSGGQRFNNSLSIALGKQPDILCLDEPTNHLDSKNKHSLSRMIGSYRGTIFVVTHDISLLKIVDILWHVDNGKISVFSGNYDDYMKEMNIKRSSTEQELRSLNKKQKNAHQALMQEQSRASKSKSKGQKSIEQKKWPKLVSNFKSSKAQETIGDKKSTIKDKREEASERLSELRLPEVIVPTFSLRSKDVRGTLLHVDNGSVGYGNNVILHSIYLNISANDRVAVCGDNGSGKTTLIRAILKKPAMTVSGIWNMPDINDIGYLDQHYATLYSDDTVVGAIKRLVQQWDHRQIRKHLNDFLFKKNEEINTKVSLLSGGEKARLSLAQIAARTPKFLILDEITNNLDLETRGHVIEVLKDYPGAMIVISHDEDFLDRINIQRSYAMQDGTINSC